MKDKAVRINLNILIAILLVVSFAVNIYLYVNANNVYSVLREYNARAAVVQSDMNEMATYAQQWTTAVSYQETYRNYFYLKSISDNYNKKLPGVKQNLLDYSDFIGKNRDLLVSVSINAPLEIKNVENLLETYENNVGYFSDYLLAVQNATASQ